MNNAKRRAGAPEWLILIGACVFIFALGLSAYWEADIRWLHFFQAWMYVGTIMLSLRGSRWGQFIGFSAAGLWAYMNVFATTFFFNGLQQLSQWLHTGHLARPDLLIAVPAWFSNVLVVLGCVWAYSRQPEKPLGDIGKLFLTFALTTSFFALDMALFQPRYLSGDLSPSVAPAPALRDRPNKSRLSSNSFRPHPAQLASTAGVS